MANPHYPPYPDASTFLGVEPLLAVGAAGAAGAFGVEPLLQPRGNGSQQGAMVFTLFLEQGALVKGCPYVTIVIK